MSTSLRRLYRYVSGIPAEDRPGFKSIDASPARYDDGAWLQVRYRRPLA